MVAAGIKEAGAERMLRFAGLRRTALRLPILPLAMSACAVLVLAFAVHGAEKYRPTPIGSSAASKISDRKQAMRQVQGDFAVGDKYSLNVTRGGVVQSYEGKLLKVTDRWIVLRDYSTFVTSPTAGRWSKVPLVGDWVRRGGEKPAEVDRWIPRDAVTVVSHSKALKPVTIRTPLGNEPPLTQDAHIELVRDGKIVSPSSDSAEAGDAKPKPLERDSASRRKEPAQRDVLCISFSRPCLNPEEAK